MRKASARLVLLALAAVFVAAAATPIMKQAPPGMVKRARGDDDALFEAVVSRVRGGETYYAAMGGELRSREYPTASAFNWRLPTLYVLLGKAPWVRPVVPIALGILAIVLTALHLNRTDAVSAVVVGVVAEVGAIRAAVSPVGQLQTEAWSGILIVISLLMYARRAWVVAAILGVAALFVRELAAPYCVICAVLAARERRVRELGVWLAGGAGYAAFYAAHVARVWAESQPGDLVTPYSWIQFGGLSYLMEMLEQNNSVLLGAPHVVVAAATVLLIGSIWAPAIPSHLRVTVVVYVLVFGVVGQSFNDYWGFVTAPAYAVAFAYGVAGIRALTKQAAIIS